MGLLALSLLLGAAGATPSHLLSNRQASSRAILDVPESAWASLNEQVSGRLHGGRPYALPCYETYQNATGSFPNAAARELCDTIQKGLTQSTSLVEDFGSYHSMSFGSCIATGEKCTLSPEGTENPVAGTCHQGSVPNYYVEATGVEDIQAALKFADEHDLPITIKNTGHDYKGRSAAPDTFSIWTHKIQPDIVLDEDFTPEGCDESSGPVITYGAGQMFNGIYEFIAPTPYLVLAGTCPTVGAAGGWLAGGGHGGPYSNKFGLGVDNAQQIKVVLPNGEFITTNRCQNQDMFFALRGGGGGTFGVVTEVSAKVYKDTSFTFASLGMMLPEGEEDLTEILVKNGIKWAEEGWGGYLGIGAGNRFTFIAITPELSVEEAETSLAPIYEFLESVSANGTVAFRKNITSLPNQAAFQATPEAAAFVQEGIGSMIAQSSRLVRRATFEDEATQKKLIAALLEQPWGGLLVTPTVYELPESDQPGNVGASALTPAWRDSVWHLVYQAFFDPADPEASTPEAIADVFRRISTAMDKVRAIDPDGGAYMNEGDTYEPDPINSYWGQENYDRLLKIKREVDPKNLLSCFKCVGWDEEDPRHRCYPKL